MHQQYTVILIIGAVLFGIFRRVRRNIGWQQLNPRKLTTRTIIFLIIGLLFLVGTLSHPISLISDIVGIALGALLAYYGAVMTRFEQRNGQMQYRPNTWIGSIVTVLFLARLVYRFYEMYMLTGQGGFQPGQSANGMEAFSYSANAPWSSGLLLIMFAYYVVYYFLLLRRQKRLPNQASNA